MRVAPAYGKQLGDLQPDQSVAAIPAITETHCSLMEKY
jgi:hypothetical protein